MKISLNWLKQHIEIKETEAEIADILTNTGLEVEEYEQIQSNPNDFEHVVVGYVKSTEQHPNADKLKLTQVDVGEDNPLSIVCGAPNVAAGQKVVVAKIGAKLIFPDGKELKIKKGKIRGEVSEGMICAEDELGLGNNHDGIMVLTDENIQVGTQFSELASIEKDTVFEIGLTPNRIDAACHLGVAKDIAAVLNRPLLKKQATTYSIDKASSLNFENKALAHCKRYSYAIIKGVKVGESPEWLQNKLAAIGLQSINNIVDVTNYVMHDICQPMHAFNLNKLNNTIQIRLSNKDEKLTLLDNKAINCEGSELLICNDNQAIALAGVMGGLDASIDAETQDILLESAYFNPSTVRQSAKLHGLNTDSSFRFERGTDPNNTVHALNHAIELILQIAGGVLEGGIVDFYPEEITKPQVELSFERLNQIAGYQIGAETVKQILIHLGLDIISQTKDGLKLAIPTNKPDVTREIDVIEEVMRIQGFDKVPYSQTMLSSLPSNKYKTKENLRNKLRNLLVGKGFFELKTNPLSQNSKSDSVLIANPLSVELSSLRTNHIESGFNVLRHNINRQQKDLKLFEFANEYSISDEGKYIEQAKLSLWLTGNSNQKDWRTTEQSFDFYAAKAILNALLEVSYPYNYKSEASQNKQFNFGLDYYYKKKLIAQVGEVHSDVLEQNELDQTVYVISINEELLLKLRANQQVKFETINKFPTVYRDLSFIVSKDVPYIELKAAVEKLNINILSSISCFDIYKGSNIQKDHISYALRFIFENKEKTLKDKQVDFVMNQITENLEEIGCQIRK